MTHPLTPERVAQLAEEWDLNGRNAHARATFAAANVIQMRGASHETLRAAPSGPHLNRIAALTAQVARLTEERDAALEEVRQLRYRIGGSPAW